MAIEISNEELEKLSPKGRKNLIILCFSMTTSMAFWIIVSIVIYHYLAHIKG